MSDLIFPMPAVAAIFFVVSFIYSTIGLGGGSSYTALLAIFGLSYRLIPGVSLTLNIIVTTLGAINFIRNGYGKISLILPFIITSIPMSYIGAMVPLPAKLFHFILMISLIIVACRIYLASDIKIKATLNKKQQIGFSMMIGILLGFLSGAIGIGGGVYLVPIIIILGIGSQKEAAAAGAVFIIVNSVSGLYARIQLNEIDFMAILPLIVAVILGGFSGSMLGSSKIKPETMQKLLGMVILLGIIFLFRKVFLL